MSSEDLQIACTCARGTEKALKFELRNLGIGDARSTGHGAVTATAKLSDVPRLNRALRIAHRVLWRLVHVRVDTAEQLTDALTAFEYEQHLRADTTIAVEAHLHDVPWTHTHYAAQRVKDCVVDHMRARGLARPNVEPRDPDVRYVLHWQRGEASLYLDTSGQPLHRRGYRVDGATAPMRETLAAALLAIGHADVQRPFVDPVCGSGTLAIEQALRSLDRAPNAGRSFPWARWPFARDELAAADARALEELAERERSELRASVRASDFSLDALAVAKQQVAAAGVRDHVTLARAEARRAEIPEGAVVVGNLPFGERLGREHLQLRGFYRGLGEHLAKHPGRRVLLFSGNPQTAEWIALGRHKRWRLMSGALEAHLYRWDL